MTSGANESIPDTSEFALRLKSSLRRAEGAYIDPQYLFNQARKVRRTQPMPGTIQSGEHQEGGSFLFFRRQAAVTPAPDPDPTPASAAPPEHPIPGNMVRVEGGTFRMGSTSGDDDEKPLHQVTVKSFYMGKYEVTQKEWGEVMGSNPSHFKGDDLPVESVNWIDAIEYCNKRSQQEGLKPCYRSSGGVITCDWSANGYRLPTEAEWEYAAKGGGRDFLEYEYTGDSNPDTVAWYRSNSGKKTHPVGTKAGNSLGIYDMSGNVWEWCWDWKGAYESRAQSDPVGAASGTIRVCRGGSWGSVARNIRSAIRVSVGPSDRYFSLGFRLVRPAQ
jgi:formylglycine-generating enzyme required for sulfatase activity